MTTRRKTEPYAVRVRQQFRQLSPSKKGACIALLPLCQNGEQMPEFQRANRIMAYHPLPDEPFRCPSCKKICSCQGNIPSYLFKPTTSSSDVTSAKTTSMLGRLASWNPPLSHSLSQPWGNFLPPQFIIVPAWNFTPQRSTPRARQRFHDRFSRPPWRHVGPQIGHLLPLSDIQPHPDRATTFSWIAWSISSPFPHHVRMLRCFLFGLKPRRDFSGF